MKTVILFEYKAAIETESRNVNTLERHCLSVLVEGDIHVY